MMEESKFVLFAFAAMVSASIYILLLRPDPTCEISSTQSAQEVYPTKKPPSKPLSVSPL